MSWCKKHVISYKDFNDLEIALLSSGNTLRPRQNGHHFVDDTFKRIFLNENVGISLRISLKFVPMVRINSIQALVQTMAWRWPGDKPLSEPKMVSLLMRICVTWPQWVNGWAMWYLLWGIFWKFGSYNGTALYVSLVLTHQYCIN